MSNLSSFSCCKGSIFPKKIKKLKNVKRVCPKRMIKGKKEELAKEKN